MRWIPLTAIAGLWLAGALPAEGGGDVSRHRVVAILLADGFDGDEGIQEDARAAGIALDAGRDLNRGLRPSRQGPEDLLTRTDRAQPSLYATSYALWEALAAAVSAPPAAAAGQPGD